MKRPLLLICTTMLLSACAASRSPFTSIPPAKHPTPVSTGPASIVTSPPRTLFNGWKLTPAGHHAKVAEMPFKLALSPDGTTLAAVCGGERPGLALLDVNTKQTSDFLNLPRAFSGLAYSTDGSRIYLTGGNSDVLYIVPINKGRIGANPKMIALADSLAPPTRRGKRDDFLTGIAVHPTTGMLYICSEATSEIWVVDPLSGRVHTTYRTGPHPHSIAFGFNPRYLYASLWGDRSVIAIDLLTGKQALRTPVGIRPNDMALAKDGRLFIACAGDNTVHVIQTKSPVVLDKDMSEQAPPPEAAIEVISTSLYPSSPEGSTPDGVAVSPDGQTLFVANADNNDVAVIDIANPAVSRVVGFVPTAWYPTSVASNGKTLFVANGKALGGRPNIPAQTIYTRDIGNSIFDAEAAILTGTVSFIDAPTGAELNAYTDQVRANCPYIPEYLKHAKPPATQASSTTAPASVIPLKHTASENCPIKHVLYIIKENRTYDQVLGDLKDANGKPIGNGDPKLTLFGEKISPNHHQLAREYVTLDNLYCNGEVSLDGHSWCDGAIANDYRQRAWTIRYTGHGQLPGNEDMWNPAAGYLWDACLRNGVSFKCYGEGARDVATTNRGTWPGGRDMDRVKGWIDDLHTAEKTGDLPQFMIMSLGEDHTRGTTPKEFTPQSCVASNDIGLAKIVEAASKSKFWESMAIFVIEDDAQNGPDHVDSHRTVGFVISPYTRRGIVDSTPYTTTSMVRTMELILGLPPMTQYDAAATPMYNCFQSTPSSVPYKPLVPQVDLNAKNTHHSPGAAASAKMDFDEYDEAPEDELNRILWLAVMGPDVPYQVPIHRAIFTR